MEFPLHELRSSADDGPDTCSGHEDASCGGGRASTAWRESGQSAEEFAKPADTGASRSGRWFSVVWSFVETRTSMAVFMKIGTAGLLREEHPRRDGLQPETRECFTSSRHVRVMPASQPSYSPLHPDASFSKRVRIAVMASRDGIILCVASTSH